MEDPHITTDDVTQQIKIQKKINQLDLIEKKRLIKNTWK